MGMHLFELLLSYQQLPLRARMRDFAVLVVVLAVFVASVVATGYWTGALPG